MANSSIQIHVKFDIGVDGVAASAF